MQTPSFVIRNLLYIIKCCKVFVNSMFVFRQRQRAENPPCRLRIFVKDAHLQNFLSFLKKTLDFPGGGRYNKTRSPARTPREYAPVAQLDRVSDYESEGCRFDSYWVHHREIAQFGRAPGLGPGGRRFESCCSDHLNLTFLLEMNTIKTRRMTSFFVFKFNHKILAN